MTELPTLHHPRIESVEELEALPADSVVLVEFETWGQSPLMRWPDGNWYGHGSQRGGTSSAELLRPAKRVLLLYRGDRPVTAGLTQIETVHVMADYLGWVYDPISAEHVRPLAKFTRGEMTALVSFSKSTGRLTRLSVPGWLEGATSGVLQQVLSLFETEAANGEEDES